MKKYLLTVLTGLTAFSMAAATPVTVLAAENDAAETVETSSEGVDTAQETKETSNEGTDAAPETNETSDEETEAAQEIAEAGTVTSTPEVHEDTIQNEDGSTTTTTTSTVTETTTTPLEPIITTTPVSEKDSDYHTITDEEGNELEAYEKTTTTAGAEVSTETVTTTTMTTETSQMTNAVEPENAVVENVTEDAEVAPANPAAEAAAKEFLEDQNVTSDFAIYADKLDESIGHVDGNVAVNTMATGGQVDIMNKDDSQYGEGNANPYAENGYSYIGSTENGTTIKTTSNQTKDGEVLSKLVVGENVTVTDNAHGSAGHFQLETAETKAEGGVTSESAEKLAAGDKRFADIETASDIKSNLDRIAAFGQKLIDATKDEEGAGSADNDLNKITAAIESLFQRKDAASENGTNILNITIHSRLLTDSRYTNELNNTKLFQDLVRKNVSNTKVIVSVDCGDADEVSGITSYCNPSNDINNYDNRAANLFWNFGAYAGKITLESQWLGNIIAANATVHANAGIQSGRIVARTAGHKGGEIHMAVSGNVVSKKVTGEPMVTRSDKKSVIVLSEPDVTYKYRLKDKPSEPVVPETPSEPDQPTTPDQPTNPDAPTTPDVPVNLSTPDAPVIPTTDTTKPDTDSIVPDTNVATPSEIEKPSTPEKPDRTNAEAENSTPAGNVGLSNVSSPYTGELPQNVHGEARLNETSPNTGENVQLVNGDDGRRLVQTGDESNMPLWGGLFSVSLCALVFSIAAEKRKSKTGQDQNIE